MLSYLGYGDGDAKKAEEPTPSSATASSPTPDGKPASSTGAEPEGLKQDSPVKVELASKKPPLTPAGDDKENMAPKPESSAGDGDAEDGKPAASAVGVSKNRTKKSSTTSAKRCTDHGESGFYLGPLSSDGKRHGTGKMVYDRGNSYDGPFVDDKFHGESGIYRWADGDEQEGGWREGERHGVSIFRSAADGSVEYSNYVKGKAEGEGVWWSADRKTAHKLDGGAKASEISLGMAEKIAKDKFGLPVPEPTQVEPAKAAPAAEAAPAAPSGGLFGSLFSSQKVGPNGEPMFKDYSDWGTYDGAVDSHGKRQGKGKMKYDSGNTYDGGFVNDKFDCDRGVYHWADGDEYDGSWKDGERHGVGIFRLADGSVEYSMYESGASKGDGVVWTPDRKAANKTVDGVKKGEMTPEEAERFAKETFGLAVPEPHVEKKEEESAEAKSGKGGGILGRFFSSKKESKDGKPMFKDYGDWGSYEGEVDSDGKRQGKGKMTYDSGNYYDGTFEDDKFHGEKGVYHWADGDEYEGSWKNGERHGVGIFRLADGSVDYSKYEEGSHVGEGVAWSPDRKTAHKTLAGKKDAEISAGIAEQMAKAKFDLPVPEPAEAKPSEEAKSEEKPKKGGGGGIFQWLFSSKRVGPDGKDLFKDYGEWGAFEGTLDSDGKRQGAGKMTYDSGNFYDGPFVDDKFHGDKGKYSWVDGDEYVGAWKDGERHGVGVFSHADGTAEYSTFESGSSKGEGVWWSADRKSAYTLMDGEKKVEILVEEAEKIAKEKFGLGIPEVTVKADAPKPPASPERKGLLGRLFGSREDSVVGPDGKLQFKDNGDWGTYDGDLDPSGKRRHGTGTMTYGSGNTYKGPFANNRYHGESGVYSWADGDSYKGRWLDGERDGVGTFQFANGSVEFSMYERGSASGEGVWWSPDRKTARKIIDGEKKHEISLALAEHLSKEKFDLPIPETFVPGKPKARASWIFGSRENEGTKEGPRFEDFGDGGVYHGDLQDGARQGEGKMLYDSGNSYEGDFSGDKFDGNRGLYRWADGTEYEGSWKAGKFDGIGIYRDPSEGVDYAMYDSGYAFGVGVAWNSDFSKAYHTLDGVRMDETTLGDAEKLAKEKFGLPPPSSASSSSSNRSIGLLGRLFSSQKVGPNGEPMFKDHGDWGAYSGGLDGSGKRHGHGKMAYDSGNSYEGGFLDDKFHGDKGVYRWDDGDEYEGSWKDGERHGVGVFRSADGSVDFSTYEKGSHVGEGVMWSPDRQTVHKTMNGKKSGLISAAMAEEMAKKFGLPVPEPAEVASKPEAASSTGKSGGFFSRLFSNKRTGPDGKPMFKDYGDWGTWEGEVDADGSRQGPGRMTYESGNTYEGSFKDDKFHGEKGTYSWSDGDEYVGSWEDGERHGMGSFKNSDGSIGYSMYEKGEAKGDGVKLSSDRKTAHALADGAERMEMLIEEAEALVSKFGFS